MRFRDFRLLADENIHPAVVGFLRDEGFEVWDVKEHGLHGSDDESLLRLAFENSQVILTHDRDFGKLAVAQMRLTVGIVYLRPGHIDPEFTIQTLQTILNSELELQTPFIVVSQRNRDTVSIRVRGL
jgi:predicted nuclease of predicted toxin-antitoxin system